MSAGPTKFGPSDQPESHAMNTLLSKVAASGSAVEQVIWGKPGIGERTGRTVIESLGIYLPQRAVSTADVIKGCDKAVAFPLEQMTGIRSRRMAGDGEYAIDLARKAVADCLASSRHTPSAIDVLICCNISRYDGPGHRFTYEPCTGAGPLRRDFDLESRVLAFDISNACAGMFTAIYLIDSMLQAGLIRRGMAVSGEYITHLSRTAQREIEAYLDPRLSCLTVGDAGAALLLERTENSETAAGFEAIDDAYTLGAHSRHCVAKATERPHGGAIMFTDPMPMTAVALKHGRMHAEKTLRDRGWSGKRIDHLILHQTSEMALRGAVRELGATLGENFCRPDNTIINVAERGNTATTTHLLALYENVMNGRIQSGDRVVFGISGSGQTVGTALYTLDDLPDRLREKRSGNAPRSHVCLERDLPVMARPGVRIESLGIAPQDPGGRALTLGLVRAAAVDCFSRSKYRREDVDLLMFAGVYRSEFLSEPAVAALAAGELEINADIPTPEGPKTLAFDVVNGGVGFLNACHIAAGLIRSGKRQVALVTASEVENNRPGGPGERTGIMETGSAVILEAAPDGDTGFGAFLFRSFPEHALRLGASTEMVDGQLVLNVERDPELADIYRDCIALAVRELLAREGLSMADLRVILPSQVAPGFVAALAAELEVDPARCVDIAVDGNDLLSSSVVYSMQHALDRGMVKAGDLGLVIAVGSGIQVGCALYRF